MPQHNKDSSKQKYIEFHGKLKSQFLELHKVPLLDDDFIEMAKLLQQAGVQKVKLDSFFKDNGSFDYIAYTEFKKLAEQTIISLHSEILKLP